MSGKVGAAEATASVEMIMLDHRILEILSSCFVNSLSENGLVVMSVESKVVEAIKT